MDFPLGVYLRYKNEETMSYYKFQPILKQTIWGGDRIIPFKHLSDQLPQVGESWEISGVPGDVSVVANGPEAGKNLNDLVAEQKDKLLGRANYERFGTEFPLLIKFIDARQDLSIQVHPSDEIAQKQGKPRGKTEMWCVMDSAPDAHLRAGLKEQITPEEYAAKVEDDTITDAIADYQVKEGDVFFLPAGRIHSIGAGCFLAEIQQTSDVTYRIYDFKRRDKNGNYRELHTAQAAECIDYRVEADYQTHYDWREDERMQVVSCPYFTTSVYNINKEKTIDYVQLDSFVILIALKGAATLTIDGETAHIQAGESVLLPATAREVKVEGALRFVETYV